jgi:histidinol-phosphate aminotransferase
MQRRTFLRTSLSAGALGAGGLALAPRLHPVAAPQAGASPIRLSSNENPLGISPAAREAIVAEMSDANRYPRRRGEIIEALAAKHGVGGEHIVLGAGSTEVLKMAVQALASPNGTLILADPTYEDALFYGAPFPLRVEKVPLTAEYAHNLDRMRARAEAATGRVLVFLCNPNNPTGTLTLSAAIDAWIREAPPHVHFLVDEAYFDYVEDDAYWTALRWIPDRPNVLVARTFSKVYGMAGVRLGYGIMHANLAQRLRSFHVRNNANHFAIVGGLASLGDDAFVRQSLAVNERGKQVLYRCLDELQLAYLPSHTNFVMHRITGDLGAYRTRMREVGIWVGRPFPPMLDHCRLSIGLPSEMETFAETLRKFRLDGSV